MVSKGITLLAQTAILSDDSREWKYQAINQKTWVKFKIFFHRAHHKKGKAITTADKGRYTVAIQNMHGAPPPSPEEHHEAIYHINTTVQGIQIQSHWLDILAQSNAVLTISNTKVMAHLSQIAVTMNNM